MARRSDHSLEEIRDMVLVAAERIINEQGVTNLTVRKIALDIGYTVGSIYMVFANMQELLLHIKGATLHELATQLHDVPAHNSVDQQLQAMAAVYVRFATDNFNRWSILFEADVKANADYPQWYQDNINAIFLPVEQLFKQINPAKTPEDALLAARALWCGVHGICALTLKGNLGKSRISDTSTAVHGLVHHFMLGWKVDA